MQVEVNGGAIVQLAKVYLCACKWSTVYSRIGVCNLRSDHVVWLQLVMSFEPALTNSKPLQVCLKKQEYG